MNWTPLEKIFLGAFVFWCLCGLIFTVGAISPADAAAWPLPGALHAFINLCLRIGDPLLILLAFANTHFMAARQWGPQRARHWALIVLVGSLLIETCGTLTGFPFGAYTYTDRFGPSLGVVPLAIPLAWHVVLTNSLFLVWAFRLNLARWGDAILTGLLATLYDAVLEPFATRSKGYWIWHTPGGAVPLQNYVAWLILGAALVFAFAPSTTRRPARDPRPAIILGATVVLFLAGIHRG